MANGKPKAGGVHAGHRKRMRQRFLTNGLSGFQDHEILELLLFYAMPRKDVNTTAHMLLNRFGSLSGVLDASEEALCDVEGVGPHIAQFLNLIPEIMVQLARTSIRQDEAIPLRTPKDAADFLARRPKELPLGHILLVLTDAVHMVVSACEYASFQSLNAPELVRQAANSRSAAAVLIERVDDCAVTPSPLRLRALEQLARHMDTLEIPLWDFFTVDGGDALPRSYARNGLLLPR